MKLKILRLFIFIASFFSGPLILANNPPEEKNTDFFSSIANLKRETLKKLLSNPDNKDAIDYLDSENKHGSTELISAVNSEDMEIIRLLIDAKVDVDRQDKEGRTALMHAVVQKNIEIIKLLINAKADINHQDTAKFTPLLCAVSMGQPEIVKLLLPEIKSDSRSKKSEKQRLGLALIYAVLKEDIEIIELLIKNKADINYQDNENESTPLMLATMRRNEKIATLLIIAGADVDRQTQGVTALMIAAHNGDIAIFKKLLVDGKAKSGDPKALSLLCINNFAKNENQPD